MKRILYWSSCHLDIDCWLKNFFGGCFVASLYEIWMFNLWTISLRIKWSLHTDTCEDSAFVRKWRLINFKVIHKVYCLFTRWSRNSETTLDVELNHKFSVRVLNLNVYVIQFWMIKETKMTSGKLILDTKQLDSVILSCVTIAHKFSLSGTFLNRENKSTRE